MLTEPPQSSSFIGPLIVGLVADRTGNIHYRFLFLVAMLRAALPILAGVDVERGRIDAHAWSSGDDGHEAEGPTVSQPDDGRGRGYQLGLVACYTTL